jgi:hypothetical protein
MVIMINDARCKHEIKSRIVMAKGAFNRIKTSFISKLDLNLRKKLATCYVGAQYRMVVKLGHITK